MVTNTPVLSDDLIISVRGLTRTFNDFLALRGVDIDIAAGERVAVLGPNGAGKTTLLKVLSSAITSSSGEVTIRSNRLKDKNPEVRRYIGVVSHQTFLYQELTAYENFTFYCRMYDVPEKDQRIKEIVDKVGMTGRLHDRVSTLSRGMLQRLSIGRALLHNPEILLLDEPDTGLDWHSLSSLWEIINNEDGINRTIIFTTHNLNRGCALSNRVIIMNKGKIVHDVPSSELDAENIEETYTRLTGGIE
ncbi:ABC transporter ATP-binding protein [Chloroflexota bacterium]